MPNFSTLFHYQIRSACLQVTLPLPTAVEIDSSGRVGRVWNSCHLVKLKNRGFLSIGLSSPGGNGLGLSLVPYWLGEVDSCFCLVGIGGRDLAESHCIGACSRYMKPHC